MILLFGKMMLDYPLYTFSKVIWVDEIKNWTNSDPTKYMSLGCNKCFQDLVLLRPLIRQGWNPNYNFPIYCKLLKIPSILLLVFRPRFSIFEVKKFCFVFSNAFQESILKTKFNFFFEILMQRLKTDNFLICLKESLVLRWKWAPWHFSIWHLCE